MSAPASKPAPAPDEAVERETQAFLAMLNHLNPRNDPADYDETHLEPLIAASREAGRRERDAEVEAARSLSRTAATAQYTITNLKRDLATARAAAEQARADTAMLDAETTLTSPQGLPLTLRWRDLIANSQNAEAWLAARGAPHAAGGSDGH